MLTDVRPDPDTFTPLALVNPEHVKAYRAFLNRVSGRDGDYPEAVKTEPPSVVEIEQQSWWSPPITIFPEPTWFSRMVDFLGQIEGPREKAVRAKKERLREGVVWGLWAGFHAGAAGAPPMDGQEELVNDWLDASAYASNSEGINYAFWSEVLLSPDTGKLTPPRDTPDDAANVTPPRDPPLAPALPPRALIKSLLLPAWPRYEHVRQVLRAAPWPTAGGDASMLEQAAPSLPGILASSVFADLALFLSGGEWSQTGQWSARDPARAWLQTMVQEGGSLAEEASAPEQVVRDKRACSRILQDQRIWQRHRPLRPPFSCVDLLHVALWANLGEGSFHEVIEAVRSLGGDALGCAAAGALFGGRYGKDALPGAALSGIPQSARIAEMAKRFGPMKL